LPVDYFNSASWSASLGIAVFKMFHTSFESIPA
jgi:hypothetical protein